MRFPLEPLRAKLVVSLWSYSCVLRECVSIRDGYVL